MRIGIDLGGTKIEVIALDDLFDLDAAAVQLLLPCRGLLDVVQAATAAGREQEKENEERRDEACSPRHGSILDQEPAINARLTGRLRGRR